MSYKPIGKDKWLNLKEDKLIDYNGNVTYYHEIIISTTDPNVRDSTKKYNTNRDNRQEIAM